MTYMYFADSELYCKCGKCEGSTKDLMKPEFMRKIIAVRAEAGFPFHVTSAYRCPEHNNAVSNSGLTGVHTTGGAIDISVSHGQSHRLLELAFAAGFSGVGVNQKGAINNRFIHLDDESAPDYPRPTSWSY